MALSAEFEAHLQTATTSLCRCWRLTRRDGVEMGFTDHDRDLDFDGTTFRAGTGLTAAALEQTSGLSVNNSSAVGALSDASVTEADLLAGRYDGAEVVAYLVNWQDTTQRTVQFRGSLGEIRQGGVAFEAELRGLTEVLNLPQGRVFQSGGAGGPQGFGSEEPGFTFETSVLSAAGDVRISVAAGGFSDRFFERGRFDVLSGAATGLIGVVKNDRINGETRVIELWQSMRAPLVAGDMIRVAAGSDGRAESHKARYGDLVDFRGFPHIPGEDWLMAYPRSGEANDGGPLK